MVADQTGSDEPQLMSHENNTEITVQLLHMSRFRDGVPVEVISETSAEDLFALETGEVLGEGDDKLFVTSVKRH